MTNTPNTLDDDLHDDREDDWDETPEDAARFAALAEKIMAAMAERGARTTGELFQQ